MAYLQVTNRALSSLAASILAADTSLSVATGGGALFPASNFAITIGNERILVGTRTTDSFTVLTRGYNGTTAADHASATVVELRVIAAHIIELQTGKQDVDATLTSISALGTAADKMAYTTGVDIWAEGALTAAGRALIDDADAAAQRVTLGAAPLASPTFTGTVTIPTPFTLGAVSVLPTGTELNFVDGVTSAIQTQLDGKQAVDADLTALAGLAGTGIAVRSAADTWVQRVIAGTLNQVNVANGDGIAGNPTLSLPQDIHTGANPTFAGLTSTGLISTASLTSTGAVSLADTISQSYGKGTQTMLLHTKDFISDTVISGHLPATSTTLTSDIGAGIAYSQGRRIVKPVEAHTYTASKDTYLDLKGDGTYIFTEVLNAAAAPAIAADSIRLAKVVTDAAAITAVADLRQMHTVFAGIRNFGIGVLTPNNTIQVADLINFNNSIYGTFLGYRAGKVTTGSDNTFIGYQSGLSNTTGYENSAMGYHALYYNTTGYENSAMGRMALLSNTTGYSNSAMGRKALLYNTTGYGNIALGYQAGLNITTGNRNIIIGYDVNAPSATGSYQLNIGNLIFGTNLDGIGATISTGSIGIGKLPTAKLDVAGSISQDYGFDTHTMLLHTRDFISDTIISGLLPATSTTLTSDISSGVAYSQGRRIVKVATSNTYTASSDTYVDLKGDGTYIFTAVANAAAAPAIATDSIRLAKVVTDATAITGVTDLRQMHKIFVDSFGNIGIKIVQPTCNIDTGSMRLRQTLDIPTTAAMIEFSDRQTGWAQGFTWNAYYDGASWKHRNTDYIALLTFLATGELVIYTGPSLAADSAPTWSEKLRLTNIGNFSLGGTVDRATTVGTKVLNIFDGTAPAGTLAAGCSIYSTTGELYTMDAGGTATLQTPHDSETGEWIFFSQNVTTGKSLKIKMEKIIKKLDGLLGGGYVEENG